MWKSIIFLMVMAGTAFAATDKIVCYHGSWAVYRPGTCKFAIENIDPNLCTHIIYGFVGINSDGTIRIMDTWNDIDLGAFKRFSGLRSQNKNLKSLIAIGGWNEGSVTFSNVASNPTLRANFIRSAINFLQTYGFDGFDLDWEYPAQRGGAAIDKSNFSKMLAEFREAFDPLGFLLTAAVAAAGPSVDLSFEVPALSKYLDFINVMTYDLHGAWESNTGQNSPLYASSIDQTENQKELNIDACIQGWIRRGADPQKLILGVGTYGRSFTLSSSSNPNLGAPAIGGGTAGPCTREAGIIGYSEVCTKIATSDWTVIWDDEQKVPYAYNGNQWIGFDNPKSIALKVEYAKNMKLGGIMVWSVETDDFMGACGIVNPILNTIKTTLGLSSSGTSDPGTTTTTTTNAPGSTATQSTTESTTTTTKSPSVGDTGSICTAPGYIRDSKNCNVFYYCLEAADTFIVHQFQCPGDLYFDPTIIACNYATLVNC